MSFSSVVNDKNKLNEIEWPLPDEVGSLPDMDINLVPESDGLREWVLNIGKAYSVPNSVPAVLIMHSLMSLIGAGVGASMYKNNKKNIFYPNTYGGLVALPGTMKSDVIAACYAALIPINQKIEKEGRVQSIQNKARMDILNMRIARLKKASLKDGDKELIQHELTQAYKEERKLQQGGRGFISQDSTIEAEQVTMATSPRGVLMMRDELAGWFKGLEKKGQEGARSFMLEAWYGNRRFKIKRIGRGETVIESVAASVTGTIQPDIMDSYIQETRNPNSGKNDGLINRMQMLVYPDPIKGKFFDGDVSVPNGVQDMFNYLEENIPKSFDEDGSFNPIIFETDDSGYEAWKEWLERWIPHCEAQDDAYFRGHLSKYRSLIPSLALCFALMNRNDFITGNDVRQAAAWGDYLQLHARKLYFGETTSDSPAGRMIKAIQAGKIKDGITIKAIRDAKMLGRNTAKILNLAIGALTDASWIRVEEVGRGSRKVYINPKVDINGV